MTTNSFKILSLTLSSSRMLPLFLSYGGPRSHFPNTSTGLHSCYYRYATLLTAVPSKFSSSCGKLPTKWASDIGGCADGSLNALEICSVRLYRRRAEPKRKFFAQYSTLLNGTKLLAKDGFPRPYIILLSFYIGKSTMTTTSLEGVRVILDTVDGGISMCLHALRLDYQTSKI